MTISGDSHGIRLADVFQNVASNRLTGTAHAQWRGGECFVRVEEGAVSGFSQGVGKGLPIPGYLEERGWVDGQKMARLFAKKKGSRKSACTLLLESGLIDEETLGSAVTEQIEEAFFELMMRRDLSYTFEEGDAPSRVFGVDQRKLGLRLPVDGLLMESARRGDEWERIRKVVASEQDLFVLLEGWDQLDLSEEELQVAEYLDGATDVAAIQEGTGWSSFEVQRSIMSLVHQGAARPCTLEEIEAGIDTLEEAGDLEAAARMLRLALAIERNHPELRTRLAELLAAQGESEQAAAEWAQIGFAKSKAGHEQAALAAYERAVELDPKEATLQEHRLELLMEGNDENAIVAATLQLVELLEEIGLAERARTLLQRQVGANGLGDSDELVAHLAELETRRGNGAGAAELWAALAERSLPRDQVAGIEFLRRAAEATPDDAMLAARIQDLESGQNLRRQRRRRRIASSLAAAGVVGSVALVGLMEIRTAHRMVAALDQNLGLADTESISALSELEQLQLNAGWTLSGRRIEELMGRLIELRFQDVRWLLSHSRYDEAAELIGAMETELQRPDLRSTCAALARQVRLEQDAGHVLARAERMGERFSEDFDRLAGMSDGAYLDFHLRELERAQNPQTQRAILQALQQMDLPASFVQVGRFVLSCGDQELLEIAGAILRRAAAHRAAGREAEWSEAYPEFEVAALQSGLRGERAREVLTLLRGEAPPAADGR